LRVIFNESLSPYFNLAAEEYLLERGEGSAFMIWRNGKSVIIGKNQNAYAEVDASFCEKNAVKVVRRLTGGGAVFHDPGNVNFSFVCDDCGEGINFLPYVEKICKALRAFGVEAAPNGRNDIEAGGAKISGNAQCVHNCADGRKRLLHHGTLLFSADMSALEGALRVSPDKMESKGIKSVRSRVANIRDIEGYRGPADPLGFARELCRLFSGEAEELSLSEKADIEELACKKYSKWEWNYGESPRFSVERKRRFSYGSVEIGYTSRKGIIEDAGITGDFFALSDVGVLSERLRGKALRKDSLRAALSDVGDYIHGAKAEEIIKLIVEG